MERCAQFSAAAVVSVLFDARCGRAGFLLRLLFQAALYKEAFLPSLLLSVRGLCEARELVFCLSVASARLRSRLCSAALRRGFERSHSRLEARRPNAACSVVRKADGVACTEGVSPTRPCRSHSDSPEATTAAIVQSGCAACATRREALEIADCSRCVGAESLHAAVGRSSSAQEIACVAACFLLQARGEGSGEVGVVGRRCGDERLDRRVLRAMLEACGRQGGERVGDCSCSFGKTEVFSCYLGEERVEVLCFMLGWERCFRL